jgi:hypothetical protein
MFSRSIYSGPATTVTIEASWDVIHELDLDTWEGQQYDRFKNCISVNDDGSAISFETTRSIEAWKAGEPDAGRGVWTLDHDRLERILIDGKVVWGTPLDKLL